MHAAVYPDESKLLLIFFPDRNCREVEGGAVFASSVGTFHVPEAILIYFSRDVIATTTTVIGVNVTVFHYHPL